MEFMEFINGFIEFMTFNCIKPYICGVPVPRRVQKCKGLIFILGKLARCRPSKLKKNTSFSYNVPPRQFDPYYASFSLSQEEDTEDPN